MSKKTRLFKPGPFACVLIGAALSPDHHAAVRFLAFRYGFHSRITLQRRVQNPPLIWVHRLQPVSYTHLDVYKRQNRPSSSLNTDIFFPHSPAGGAGHTHGLNFISSNTALKLSPYGLQANTPIASGSCSQNMWKKRICLKLSPSVELSNRKSFPRLLTL